MRTESTRCSSLWTIIFILLLLPLGCATPTKPNIPYSGPTPQLDKIAQRNLLLATELRKLPEIQDGVSAEERDALEKIVEIYHKVPDKFDNACEQMYQVGKPDVRKYCSPLQTLFWLVEDGNTSLCNQVINKYDLKTLLIGGWTTGESIGIHSKIEEADRLEKMCIDQALKEELFPYVLPEEVINEAIKYPEKFGMKEYSGLVVDEQFEKHKKRWGDFGAVADRLNDPELIQYWINNNITYKSERINYGQSPKQTFKRKTGDCEDYSIFGVYCLNRNGYDSAVVNNAWAYHPGNNEGHAVRAYKNNKDFYKIADSNSSSINGPYGSYWGIGKSIHPGGDISVDSWQGALSDN